LKGTFKKSDFIMPVAQQKYYEENRGKDLRRNPNDGTQPYRRWVVNEMWDVHHEIARRIVLGQKNVQIAEDLNVSPQMVCNVRNSPIVQERIKVLHGARDADTVDLAKEIKEIAPEALGLLKDIIRGENDGANASINLRAKEANNMLARAGHGVPIKVHSENFHAMFTPKDIENIKARARARGAIASEDLENV